MDETRPHASIYTLPGEAPARGDTTKRGAEVIALPAADGAVERIGGYRVLHLLGRGGMGVVYLAESLALRRPVALKVLMGSDDPEAVERFLIEARAAARLKHPNVVGVHEVGRDGARWFLAMDLVDGESLRARGLREGPLAPREAARIGEAIGRALQHAHALGVIHRDVKPHNILLARDGTPLLADFGLARDEGASGITATGNVLGTPAYMPPEQASGDRARVDRRADVYSLGATLYEALTGKPPFEGPTAIHIIRQVIEVAPVPPSARRPGLDRDLETIVLRALEKEPAARYDTAAELADDLGRWSRHEPIAARRVGVVGRVARWARRRPGVAGGLVAGALAGVVVLGLGAGAALERARTRSSAALSLRAAAARLDAVDGDQASIAAAREAIAAARAWASLSPEGEALEPAVLELVMRAGDGAREAGDLSVAREAYALALARAAGGDAAPVASAIGWCERVDGALHQMNQRHYERAERLLDEAVALRPDWDQGRLARASLHKLQRRTGAALRDLEAVLADRPDHVRALAARAQLRVGLGDADGAVRDQRRVTELRPGDLGAFEELSKLLQLSGDLQGAIDCLAPVIADEPHAASTLVRRATCRLDAGDLTGAEEDVRRVLAMLPQDVPALHLLGQLDVARERFDAALATFDELVALQPRDPVSRYWRGLVLGALGEQARAVRDFDAAVQLGPHEPQAWVERARYRLRGLHDVAGAQEDLERALALQPSSSTYALAAELHAFAGREDQALAYATLAVHADPSLSHGWLLRGLLRARSPDPQDRERAAADLRRFLELAPQDARAAWARAALDELTRPR